VHRIAIGLSVTAFQSAKAQGRAGDQDDDDQLLKEGFPETWRNRMENHAAEEYADVGNANHPLRLRLTGAGGRLDMFFSQIHGSWRTIKTERSWKVRRHRVASRAWVRCARGRATRRSRDVRGAGAAARQQE